MNIKEKIINKSKTIKFESFDTYNYSYQEFVKFFESNPIDEHNLIIGCYFTYGWMPTILKNFDDTLIDHSIISKLNGVKRGEELDSKSLEILKKILNNSIIGVSKLLHFINPDLYPIWDRRVCTFICDKNYFSFVNKTSNYKNYFAIVKKLLLDDEIKKMCIEVRSRLNANKLSDVRVIELIMFEKENEIL
jgi:hypothetical protein